jgi:hypothetical protein
VNQKVFDIFLWGFVLSLSRYPIIFFSSTQPLLTIRIVFLLYDHVFSTHYLIWMISPFGCCDFFIGGGGGVISSNLKVLPSYELCTVTPWFLHAISLIFAAYRVRTTTPSLLCMVSLQEGNFLISLLGSQSPNLFLLVRR